MLRFKDKGNPEIAALSKIEGIEICLFLCPSSPFFLLISLVFVSSTKPKRIL